MILSVGVLYYYAKATSDVVRKELPEPDIYISEFLDRSLNVFEDYVILFQDYAELTPDESMSVILQLEKKLIKFQGDIATAERVLAVDHKHEGRMKEFALLKDFVEEDLLFINLIQKIGFRDNQELIMEQILKRLNLLVERIELDRDYSHHVSVQQMNTQIQRLDRFYNHMMIVLGFAIFSSIGFLYMAFRRQQDLKALGKSELNYRRLFENATEGVLQIDRKGMLLNCNPALASILCFDSPAEMMAEEKTLGQLVYVDQATAKTHIDLLSKGQVLIGEVHRWRRKDGELIWGEINAHPVKNEEGEILFHEGTFTNVDERMKAEINLRRAKEEAEFANRAKSEFLANMSHELRTPLNAVIGFSEILRTEAFGKLGHENYKDYSNDIHSAGEHLLRVINDILDVAKIEAGQMQLYEREVRLHDVVQSSFRMLSVRADQNEVSLNMEVPADLPTMIADETRLKQIFVNLISNAVKFTKPGGAVSVRASLLNSGELQIKIIDTGVGIAEKDIPTVLSRFGQAQTSYARTNEGTGIGLTLVQLIVEMHQGHFELQSVLDVGTTCIVTFPRSRISAPGRQAV
ncbi:MAG: PAS domain S-box protein [Sneathiella sp.]|nr:PAS domain S-box protein [Sneathiella sp.]